jgi:hypothetical protein
VNHKFLISNLSFTASQNGTTSQTDESWRSGRFRILFTKTGFTGYNGKKYEVDSKMFFLSDKALYPFKILPCLIAVLFLTHICICSLWIKVQIIQEGRKKKFTTLRSGVIIR